MYKLTKFETITWINHAISFFTSLGKNQKDLAFILGLDESRISEMKNGKGSLSVTSMREIIDICGAPKRAPGRFEYVEMYNDLESFHELFLPVTENLFHRHIVEEFSKSERIALLVSNCSFENREDSFDTKIEKINGMVRTEVFGNYCLKYQEYLKGGNQFFYLFIANHSFQNVDFDGVSIKNIDALYDLYRIWLLVRALPNYKLMDSNYININPVIDLTPVVLTGSRILAFMADTTLHNYPINKVIQNNLLLGIHDSSSKSNTWTDIRIELYLSESMNYNILIHMSENTLENEDYLNETTIVHGNHWSNYDAIVGKNDRLAVITNINSLDLLRQVEELRKWLGLAEDSLYELQQNIAKAGGYVPGAKVLI